jgi:hypothetical protein
VRGGISIVAQGHLNGMGSIAGIDVQSILKESLWAGLTIFLLFFYIPEKEANWMAFYETQRREFFEQQQKYEDRRDTQVKSIESQCYASVFQNLELTKTNAKLITEIHTWIQRRCDGGS